MRRGLAALTVAGALGIFVGGCSSSGDDAAFESASSVAADVGDPAAEDSDPGPEDAAAPTDPEAVDVTDRSVPADNAGGESLGPVASLDLEFETDEGNVQVGSGEIPASMDSAFPLPDDLAVTISSETVADIGVSGTTSWAFDDVLALYEAGLPAAGYEVSDLRRPTDGVAVLTFAGRGTSGQVAISAAPNVATTIIVTVGA